MAVFPMIICKADNLLLPMLVPDNHKCDYDVDDQHQHQHRYDDGDYHEDFQPLIVRQADNLLLTNACLSLVMKKRFR